MSDLDSSQRGYIDRRARVRRFSRYLDVVLVVLAAPVAIALGASPLGYLIAAGAWVLQRVLQQLDRRWIAGRGADARFGLNLVDGFGRIWLLAGAIVLAGVIGGRATV